MKITAKLMHSHRNRKAVDVSAEIPAAMGPGGLRGAAPRWHGAGVIGIIDALIYQRQARGEPC